MSNNSEALAANEALNDINRVGKEFMQVAAGRAEGVARSRGLLVTNEDVRRIQRYVSASQALPVDLAHIRQLLGQHESSIVGLQPEDIRQLNLDIQEHAGSWAGLEKDMRAVGSNMHVFAGNLITTLESVNGALQGLDSWNTLKLGEMTEDQAMQLPEVELVEGDRKQLPGILELVGELRLFINDHLASTTRVKAHTEAFKDRLRGEVSPAVVSKINLANSAQASDETVQIKERIRLLNERIEQKDAEYQTFCSYRWVGFWWGPIGGAISLSIYGPKATAVLEEKDRLITEKTTYETQLRQVSRFVSDLYGFESNLQDLKLRIDGAISSANNIESLWILLEELVDSSHRQLRDISNAMYLVVLVNRFRSAISNWVDIRKDAFDLLASFNNAAAGTVR